MLKEMYTWGLCAGLRPPVIVKHSKIETTIPKQAVLGVEVRMATEEIDG